LVVSFIFLVFLEVGLLVLLDGGSLFAWWRCFFITAFWWRLYRASLQKY
jgi:hypothetical protein